MKTLYSVFEDLNLDLCGSQCLLSIKTNALKPAPSLFGRFFCQFKISKSGIQYVLMLASKAIIKELLGAELDIKLVVLLFAGYLFLIKQSVSLLRITAFETFGFHAHQQQTLTYN